MATEKLSASRNSTAPILTKLFSKVVPYIFRPVGGKKYWIFTGRMAKEDRRLQSRHMSTSALCTVLYCAIIIIKYTRCTDVTHFIFITRSVYEWPLFVYLKVIKIHGRGYLWPLPNSSQSTSKWDSQLICIDRGSMQAVQHQVIYSPERNQSSYNGLRCLASSSWTLVLIMFSLCWPLTLLHYISNWHDILYVISSHVSSISAGSLLPSSLLLGGPGPVSACPSPPIAPNSGPAPWSYGSRQLPGSLLGTCTCGWDHCGHDVKDTAHVSG